MHMRGTGVYGLALLVLMVFMWMWEWRVYLMYGMKRTGRSVIVNAAWEGNEDEDITVVEI